MKTYTIKVTGEDEILDMGLEAFVKASGWQEDSEQTKEDKASEIFGSFLRETIVAYKAKEAAEAARLQALEATNTALDGSVVTVVEETA